MDSLLFCTSAEIRKALCRFKPDIVWSQFHACRGPDGALRNVHALLEEDMVPYVGSSPEVLDLLMDKQALKERWREAGVRTPYSVAFGFGEDGLCHGLEEILGLEGFPYIVKPLAEGNSRGIDADSVARDRKGLHAAIQRVLDLYGAGIIEEYLYRHPDAREFTVAMLGNGAARRLMPAELVRAGGPKGVVTTADKREDRVLARPVSDPGIRASIVQFAGRAFDAAGARDYARLDLFLAAGELYAIEINGQPMVPDPWFTACASAEGFTAPEYLEAILGSAIAGRGAGSPRLARGR